MKTEPVKLRSNTLWQEACAIGEFVYGQIDVIVENFPDEKWATASKLRSAMSEAAHLPSSRVASSDTHDIIISKYQIIQGGS